MEHRRVGSLRFHGDRTESAPMTWGQRAIWKSIQWLDEGAHYYNIPRVVAAPPGLTISQVEVALGRLLTRHEALRTRFEQTEDGPVQYVSASGELAAPVHEAPPGQGATLADEVSRTLAAEPFRHREEWPFRCALVLEQGEPVHVALVFSHLGVDFWGVQQVEQDLRDLLAGQDPEPPAWQPLDQARFETEGPGAARGAASVEYWRRSLASVPPAMFPPAPVPPVETEPEPGTGAGSGTGTEGETGTAAGPGAGGETGTAAGSGADRFVRLCMNSPATAVAASTLADRCGVSTGTVLLAGTAALLGSYTGNSTAVLQLIAVNRHDERSRRLVAAMTANALFSLDVARPTFEEVIRATFLAAMNAYRFAQYDPLVVDGVIDAAREASGGALRLSSFFNDVRLHDRWEQLPGTDGSAQQLRALTAKTEVSLIGTWERQDADFFVHTTYEPDTCLLYLMADTALIPRPEIERLLRAFEHLLVESAAGLPALDTLPVAGS
ncbi:condensation domain-containing protein [Kitasatospora sp. NPDC050463]|uniref:condensation domain-containing protein n=1 Tax=Kitasatospora sp. NPDC050463 TaxID=3155786 RepID=UPI003409F4E2